MRSIFFMCLNLWLTCLTRVKLIAKMLVVTIATNKEFRQGKSWDWHRPVCLHLDAIWKRNRYKDNTLLLFLKAPIATRKLYNSIAYRWIDSATTSCSSAVTQRLDDLMVCKQSFALRANVSTSTWAPDDSIACKGIKHFCS